jgi:general secretion pathway protein M
MKAWWASRSEREQLLLGVMIALMAAVFVWLTILRPLAAARKTAESRHQAATSEAGMVRAKIATVQRLAAKPPEALGAPLPEFLRGSAAQAGFTNAVVDGAGNGRARLMIASAKAIVLLGWIDQLDARGVFIERATIRTNSDGTIAIEASFAVRGG